MRHPKGGGPPPQTNALHGFAIDGRADLLVPELYKMQCQEDGGGLDVLQRTQRLRGLLDAEDEGGCTPLMRAAFQGSMECVRALLGVGADASLVSTITGRSPLHEAVASVHDQPELISLLIVAGKLMLSRRNALLCRLADQSNPIATRRRPQGAGRRHGQHSAGHRQPEGRA